MDSLVKQHREDQERNAKRRLHLAARAGTLRGFISVALDRLKQQKPDIKDAIVVLESALETDRANEEKFLNGK